MKKQGKNIKLIINIFHHPLDYLWSRDKKICLTYFDNSLCLTGHLHDTEAAYIHGLDSRIYQCQAGGLYLGSESTWPARYQYITIDEDANTLGLDFRKFRMENHTWVLDGERGRDGKKVYDGFFL